MTRFRNVKLGVFGQYQNAKTILKKLQQFFRLILIHIIHSSFDLRVLKGYCKAVLCHKAVLDV